MKRYSLPILFALAAALVLALSPAIAAGGAGTAGRSAKPKKSPFAITQEALNGYDPCYGAIYYFNPATATSRWIWSRPLIVQIGSHRFCS